MNTNTPHKHAAIIKAWADGAAIEYRPNTDRTFEVVACPYFDGPGEYRIKPETVSYRVAIINDGLRPRTVTAVGEYQDNYFESQPNFVRWLGPRQTVEV